MAWGEIFSSPEFLSVASSAFGGGGTAGNLLSAGAQLLNSRNANMDYAAALKTNNELQAIQAKNAKEEAAMTGMLRNKILGQTSELGANLRTAYNTLGPQPIVNEGSIAADYGRLKAQGTADLNDLINLTNSQGFASGLDRLGGATSAGADQLRSTLMVKQFAPQVAAVDNNAWAQAIERATGKASLINTNRSSILNEITGVMGPELDANLKLFSPTNTAQIASNAVATNASSNQSSPAAKNQAMTDLNAAIGKLFGGQTSAPAMLNGSTVTRAEPATGTQINWNSTPTTTAIDRLFTNQGTKNYF